MGGLAWRQLPALFDCQPVVAHELRQPLVVRLYSAIMLEREAHGVHLWQNASKSNIRPGAMESIAAPPRNPGWELPSLLHFVHQVLAFLPDDRLFLQRDRANATRQHPRRHADEIVVTRERGLGLQRSEERRVGKECRSGWSRDR